MSIHADVHSSHERFSLLVLACVAGVEMGRGLGGREKGGELEREDKVSSSSLFPFALFSLSSSPYPCPFAPVTRATCVYNRRLFVLKRIFKYSETSIKRTLNLADTLF